MPLLKRCLFLVVVACFYAAVMEVAARLLLVTPAIDGFNRVNYSPVLSQSRPVVPLVGGGYTWSSAPDKISYVHHLNSSGFRDIEWPLRSNARHRIAIVGDSLIEGFLAPDDMTIPAIFRKLMSGPDRNLEVLNLGIGAAQPNEYCRLIRDAIDLLRITHLVLVFYANDFVADYDCTEIMKGRMAGELGPMQVLSSRIWYGYRFFSMYRMLPLRFRTIYPNFVPAVPDPANPWTNNEAALRPFVRPDLIEQMKAASFNPYVTNSLVNMERALRAPRSVDKVVGPIAQFLHLRNVAFSVAYIPYNVTISDYYRPLAEAYSEKPGPADWQSEKYRVHEFALVEAARQQGATFIELTEPLRAAEMRHPGRYFGGYDEHLRPDGNELIAELLARNVLSRLR